MKIPKDSLTCHPSNGKLTLQIPTYYVGSPPDFEELPDNWFISLKNDRPTTGRELGYTFLTREGYEANKDKIKDAFMSCQHRRGTWEVFEMEVEEHFEKVKVQTKKRIAFLHKKIHQLERSLLD